MVTSDNVAIIVPNGDLLSQRIINRTHGDPTVRVRVPVGVGYNSDLSSVSDALLEVAGDSAGTLFISA